MTTGELSRLTRVPRSTLNLWVKAGYLRPESVSYGMGDHHVFDENAVAQVNAIIAIRQWFGDGDAAREVLPQVAERVRFGDRVITIPTARLQVA